MPVMNQRDVSHDHDGPNWAVIRPETERPGLRRVITRCVVVVVVNTLALWFLAWLISAVWFGAAHLPTYGWNLAQAMIVIGGARLVLSLAFIRSKNLWVSAGAHILNDWSIFTVALIGNLARG